jgi:hypothetical protein
MTTTGIHVGVVAAMVVVAVAVTTGRGEVFTREIQARLEMGMGSIRLHSSLARIG